MSRELKESDLFDPIKEYFVQQGYTGDGEVSGIDLYLEKDGFSTAVELKKTLDFRSVQQAALDQRICDFVYIGIFRPRDLYSRAGKDKLYLLKRLGIGLVCVSPRTGTVDVVNDPVISEIGAFQKRHGSRAEAVRKEFKNRRIKANTGGVNKTRLMTAYREDSLMILHHLDLLGGQGTVKDIRECSGIARAGNIMYDNFYGWFENVSRGIYRVTDIGRKALDEYDETVSSLIK